MRKMRPFSSAGLRVETGEGFGATSAVTTFDCFSEDVFLGGNNSV
jgi:hypothetical protein